MGKLIINKNLVTEEKALSLIKICPFNAITYKDGSLDITSACKMCKMCVRKGGGVVEFEEDKQEVDKSLWKGICVYADCSNGKIHRITFELCGKAKELSRVTGHPVYALLIGYNVSECAKQLLHYGVDKVFVYDDKVFEEFRIEPYAAAFYDFIERYKPSSVLVGATNLGRQLAPRVAARCRTGLTADCTVLEMKENTDLVQIRPAFGGNIMAQIITPNTRPQFCTVRYKVFSEPVPTEQPSGEIVNMKVTLQMMHSAITVLETKDKPKDVDISEAEVIVAVGRGASSDAMLRHAKELADLLGGIVACSRPLVENGIFESKYQIGLSGRTVKPKLVICLGVSGAVQFISGLRAADCIIAVNIDENAPIFDVAHYCVVGDVNEIVPKLISKIKGAK
ncbi:MAG: electron transfer flavoprotein subunit alpha/FixB family protein [Clostridia bacterium]|nr:electron transfer flavoprotein subunit alpha/FixB family protein [Clostridia bacterium]